ncbi:hypothetical protein CC1G_08585 [Coprinopsis cinerea okayama7|uniref:Kinetochore protein Sos7 coiled-coil domain-containing protein n=1 Tax=Coprinopsis cinerea (strain Okayama-7 / 130 / ATCC MYA-4618 / FGSC 9003) TaxID=240176 RepID=A8NCV3_COPC7|nr:hypothetical protein CC1G_08585 [Coprinopsis cinerea okayama7\|eukprot:XP_001832635.1 hypothetical protein CC1G_08585 [Coprinopsis cinerea okayama7\
MATTRTSLEAQEQDKRLESAKRLQLQLEQADLRLEKHNKDFSTYRLQTDDLEDGEDLSLKDPAIVATDVSEQISFLRKLKFQYLEQNAKDKYVKSIVSDIDDAPIVTADDNRELAALNEEKKAKLKVAKEALAEVQHNVRTLAPMVEEDYIRVKQATERANFLAQKILDARLALLRLRQTHPHPRLTITTAEQKLADQVTEMQELSDQVDAVKKEVKVVKEKVKTGALEVEKLRIQQTESERMMEALHLEDDDNRLVPLYDWYTASLHLHRSIFNLEESDSVSENELRLTYRLTESATATVVLIFAPDTRELAGVETVGFEEVGVDTTDIIEQHIQTNDPAGLIALLLSRARAALDGDT